MSKQNNLQPYSTFVDSRLKPASHIRAEMPSVSDDAINLLHCAIGMAGEFFEMKFANSIQELAKEQGDLLFYTVGAFRATGTALPEHIEHDGVVIEPQAVMMNSMQMERALMIVLEAAKKQFFMCKPMSAEKLAEVQNALTFFLNALVSLTGSAETNLNGLIQSNTGKLTLRYANGYSNEAAAARADMKQ